MSQKFVPATCLMVGSAPAVRRMNGEVPYADSYTLAICDAPVPSGSLV